MSTVHAYTAKLREEMQRCRISVRGSNGLSDQAHLSASRLDEICNGDKPTEAEHRGICRALPRMKYNQALLLEWLRTEPVPPAPPTPRPERPAPPPPPQMPRPAAKAAPELPPTPPAPLMLVPRTFGEYLRAAREREGWSPADLASLIDVSPAAVWAWESDDSVPVATNYERLLSALPALAATDVPRPDTRDIPKPIGRGGPVQEAPAPSNGVASRSPLIAFGMSLARTSAALKSARGTVVTLLREGASAGLSTEEIAAAIEEAS